jgi:hypothetical protein
MKRLLVLLFFVLLFSSFVAASSHDSLGNLGSVGEDAKTVQEIVEGKKWEYIGERWKDTLLKNDNIAAIDGFFRKIDFVFVVLFARNYDLALELFFAFLIWLFTLLSVQRYLFFLKEGWQKTIGSFAVVVGLAHTQLFNYVSRELFRLMFFSSQWYWNLLSFVIIIVAIVFFYVLNKYISGLLSAQEAAKKVRRFERNQEKVETIAKELTKKR